MVRLLARFLWGGFRMSKFYDLAGKQVGNFKVIKRAQKPVTTKSKEAFWLCICRCGKETVLPSFDIRNSKTKSCGCMQHKGTHKKTGTAEYRCWSGMISRCTNPNNSAYSYYGGRGITVCDYWKEDFSHFYEDMGPKPSLEHSLDRIDSDKGYFPGNCKWATPIEQWENRKVGRNLTFTGYQVKTSKTAIYPDQGTEMGLVYCSLGLASEAGEFCGGVKKLLRDNKFILTTEIRKQLIDEAGDIAWYLSQIANELGIKLETIAIRNLQKLADRKNRGVLGGSGNDR